MPIPPKYMNNDMRNKSSRWLSWLSIALFVGSLGLPAYQVDYYGKSESHSGLESLLLGPVGFFAGHFSWLANPLLLGSWVKRTGRDSGLAFVLASLALIAASMFTLGNKIAQGGAGEFSYHVDIGFHLWLASMVAAGVAALIYVHQDISTPTKIAA
jgi:hypothetical protein